MRMHRLEIEKARYGEHKGKYVGRVSFKGERGDIGIILSPEVTESFLALAGDLLIAHVEVAGRELQDSIDLAVDRAKLNQRCPEEIARLFGKQAQIIKESET